MERGVGEIVSKSTMKGVSLKAIYMCLRANLKLPRKLLDLGYAVCIVMLYFIFFQGFAYYVCGSPRSSNFC